MENNARLMIMLRFGHRCLAALTLYGKMAERSMACDSSESLPVLLAGFSSPKGGVGSNPTLVNTFSFVMHNESFFFLFQPFSEGPANLNCSRKEIIKGPVV